MFKISRIFLDHFGSPGAFYKEMEFSFQRSDGTPEDGVIVATSGGGKTTFLSAFFTIFSPLKRHFISIRRRPTAKIEDYFTKETMVGAIEMVQELNPLDGSKLYLVIGQIARVSELGELEQWLFLYKSSEGLRSLPHPFYESKQPCRSWQEWERWIKTRTQEEKKTRHFRSSRRPGAFREYLDQEGVDVFLIEKQVELNLIEQGDLSGMNFRNENEFLEFFFKFTLDVEKIETWQQQIELYNARIIDLPYYRAASACYEKALPYAKNLAERLTKSNVAEKERDARLLKIHSIYHEAKRSNQVLQTQNEKIQTDLETAEHTKTDLEKRSESIKSQRLHLEWFIHFRKKKEAEERQKEIQNVLGAARRDFELLKCAKALDRYRTSEQKWQHLRNALDNQLKDIQPLQEEKRRCSSAFFHAIQKRLEKYTELEKENRETIRTCSSEIKSLTDHNKKLHTQEVRITADLKVVEARILGYEKKLHELIDANIVYEGEDVESTLKRVASFHETEKARLDNLEKDKVQQLKERKRLEHARRGNESQIAQRATQIEALDGKLQESLKQKAALEQDSVLLKYLGKETLDLYETDFRFWCENRLGKQIQRRSELGSRQRFLEEEIAYIDQHKTLKPDKSIQDALDALKLEGIQDAVYYPGYISDMTGDDATRARAIVQSNPGRFMGIALSPASLPKAKNLVLESIKKPVVISVMSDTPEPEQAEQTSFALMPKHDYAYNQSAALQRQSDLQEELNSLNQQLETMRRSIDEAQKLCDRLKLFYSQYDQESVHAWSLQRDSLKESQDALMQESRSLQEAQDITDSLLHTIESDLETQRQSVQTIRFYQQRIQSFHQDFQTIQEDKQQQAQLKNQLDVTVHQKMTNDTHLEELQNRKVALDEDKERISELISEAKNEKKNGLMYAQESDMEVFYGEIYTPLVEHEKIDSLLSMLREQTERIKAHERDAGVHHMREEIVAAESEKKLLQEAYEKSRQDARDELKVRSIEESEIKRFTESDFAVEEIRIKRSIEDSRQSFEEAKQTLTVCATHLETFLNQHTSMTFSDQILSGIFPDKIDIDAAEKKRTLLDHELTDTEVRLQEADSCIKVTLQSLQETGSLLKQYQTILDSWTKKYIPEESLKYPSQTTWTEPDQINQEKTKTLEEIETIQNSIEQLQNESGALLRKIHMVFNGESVNDLLLKESEKVAMERLGSLGLEDMRTDPFQIYHAIRERIEVMEDHINRLKEVEHSALTYLDNIAEMAINALYDINRSKLPETAGKFAQKKIIHINIAPIKNMTQEGRREILLGYLAMMAQSRSVPKWETLCSEIIKVLLQARPLDLKLLFVDEHSPGHMVKPEQHNMSDGQRLIFQIMLFITLSQIRHKGRTSQSKRKFSGFMVIDNPFGKITNKETMLPSLELGHALGIQFIYTMEQPNEEMQSVFNHVHTLKRGYKLGPMTLVEKVELTLEDKKEHWFV